MNNLSRRCGAPIAGSDARTEPHRTSNPSEARSARTASNPSRTWPETFSKSANLGRIVRMRSQIVGHRCRGSSSPLRWPALENGWQGYPPMTMSMLPARGLASNSRRSPTQIGHGSRADSSILSMRMLAAKGSRSTQATTLVLSARPSPRSRPPIPEQSDSTLRGVSTWVIYPSRGLSG